jgi:hypothetical protein
MFWFLLSLWHVKTFCRLSHQSNLSSCPAKFRNSLFLHWLNFLNLKNNLQNSLTCKSGFPIIPFTLPQHVSTFYPPFSGGVPKFLMLAESTFYIHCCIPLQWSGSAHLMVKNTALCSVLPQCAELIVLNYSHVYSPTHTFCKDILKEGNLAHNLLTIVILGTISLWIC